MAQRLPKQLAPPALLTTSAAIVYTVPANTLTTIAAATVSNPTATARTVSIHLVPLAGVADATNIFVPEIVVSSKSPYNAMPIIGHTIPAGATIQALSDASAALVFSVSGYETNP